MNRGDKIEVICGQEPFYRAGDIGVVVSVSTDDNNILCDFKNQGNSFVYLEGVWSVGKSNCRAFYPKPPLGLRPRKICDMIREEEIKKAIVRYCEADKQIPIEWLEEYNEILGRLLKK